MTIIGNPMTIPELDLRPEQAGAIQLSDDMQQTLALVAGYWKNRRVLLKALPSGILTVASPQVENIFHVTATDGDFAYQGSNIECAEVMIMGHPDNTGLIWVKNGEAATANNGWPLAKKEIIALTIGNLNNLHLLIITTAEKAIILYTK
jgi:hypothetical protein